MGNLFSIFAKRDGSMTVGAQWITEQLVAISIDLIDENKFCLILGRVNHRAALDNCFLESCADVLLKELEPASMDVTLVEKDDRKSFHLFPAYNNVPEKEIRDFREKSLVP
jgi:hypothetical protein